MTKRLYVGNLNYSVTKDDLEELFSNYGTVNQVDVIESKGFGFVEMAEEKEAEKAKEALNRTDYKGRTLRIDDANAPQSSARRGQQGGKGQTLPEVLPDEDWSGLSDEEILADLREMITKSSLKETGFGARRFYFVNRENQIPFLDISDDLTSRLEKGLAAIVEIPGDPPGDFTVVPRREALRMKTIKPEMVLFLNDEYAYEPARKRPPRRDR